MFHHDIHFAHTRHPLSSPTGALGEASSSISISVDSTDFVEAMIELLSRLPDDLLIALKAAVEMSER